MQILLYNSYHQNFFTMEKLKPGTTNSKKLSLSLLALIYLFSFQACKKADVLNSFDNNSPAAISIQARGFFTISENAPVEEKTIVNAMKNQLKENDVQDFLNWHGQPVWSKIIKFEKDKNGSVTYAIPTQKNNDITGFFAATIDKYNNIQFEMHRQSATALKKGEYSYANITLSKREMLLDYFNGKTKNAYESVNSETSSYWSCYWQWIEVTTLQEANNNQQNMEDPGEQGYWLIICIYNGGGGGGTGGGGGGGGGTGGCGGGGNTETFNYKWWNNAASLLSPCELIAVINRLSPLLGLNALQIHYLMERPNRTEEIDRYLTNNPQNIQIAKDHLDKLTQDIEYDNFVENHAQTGDPLKMWWEDENWLKINVRFGIDDNPNAPLEEPTPAEIALTLFYPVQAYLINRNASTAQTETTNRFGTNGLNDRSDAFRHAFWLAINTKNVGSFLALQFSNAHEQGVPSQFQLEKTMDLHNNAVGISLCPQPAYLAQSAWNAVSAGDCRYLDPINYSDPCFWGCNGNSLGTHGITTQTQLKTTN